MDASILSRATEDDRKAGARGRLCGECGARHVTGPCPFTRPTLLLPDSVSPPRPANQGVIMAPPHRDTPVNLSNDSNNVRSDESEALPLEETWRDPQRAGSPGCYSRASLPSGLALERRLVQPPRDTNQDDDVGVVEDSPPPPRSMEVVVARAPLARYTQLGPIVGVPVRERDIPDDFSMVNLWEVSVLFNHSTCFLHKLRMYVCTNWQVMAFEVSAESVEDHANIRMRVSCKCICFRIDILFFPNLNLLCLTQVFE